MAGVAVFAGISIHADVGALGERLRGFSWAAFIAALALAVANYAIRFVRWTLYLRHRDLEVPVRTSALVFLSGFALSVTPGKVGE
ncbi:MAG: lysylphosphatidylglycerol synthase domain-containing protein, partial [Actinomycetota bacterium]